jgi:hypothetical protein
MKIAVYTAILGDYEQPKDPHFKDEGVDYILFTDQLTESEGWDKILYVEPSGYTTRKSARAIKALPHQYLPEYDMTIWVDGNFTQKKSLLPFIEQMKKDVLLLDHPVRKCIYAEADACIDGKHDYQEIIEEQMYFYQVQGYPSGNGLVATGFIIRKNNESVNKLNEDWWNEILGKSGRDQLSFNYVAWVNSIEFDTVPFDILDTHFERNQHKHKRKQYPNEQSN